MNQIAPVTLSPYNEQWPTMFQREREIILDTLNENGKISVEHIGSTSIPGMVAKPEIDILVGIEDLSAASKFISILEKIDFLYFQRFEEFVPERRYFRKSEGNVPLVHIHMVERGSPFWNDHILFRDYLRSHPDVAQQYSDFKQRIVKEKGNDRPTYTKEKEALIQNILARARGN